MKINLTRRHVVALAAIKMLALAAVLLPPAAPSGLFPVALAAPASPSARGDLEAALRAFDVARADPGQLDVALSALLGLPADPLHQPLQEACLGSVLTLQGKAAWMPWNKMRFVEQGLDRIDAGLAMLKAEHATVLVRGVPLSLQTRLVAAATFVALPDGLFHRRADGRKLLASLRADPLLATVPAAFRAEVDATEARLKEAEK